MNIEQPTLNVTKKAMDIFYLRFAKRWEYKRIGKKYGLSPATVRMTALFTEERIRNFLRALTKFEFPDAEETVKMTKEELTAFLTDVATKELGKKIKELGLENKIENEN